MNHYLIISSEFPPGPGGIGKHAYSLAKSLVENGTMVTIIADMDYATEEEITAFIENQDPGISIHRIIRRGAATYADRIKSAIKAVKENKFTKVIVTGKFPVWVGGLLKLRFGGKIVVDAFLHGSEVRLPSTAGRLIFNVSLKLIDKIWCVSKFTKALLPDDKRILNKTGILPNGVNIKEWPANPVNNNPLHWTGQPRLLTVGNLSSRKGQHCVIKALPTVIKKYPGVHYHMVGLAKNAEKLQTLAKELGVAQHITIHGRVSAEQLIKAYESADIFCMLSENQPDGDVEGFGIAILEANIMGVAAIGSKDCGIEDAIENGFNGYLVDPENHDAFTKSISLIMETDKDTLRQNCIKWAYKHDWNQLAKSIL